jgi:DtxR family Mn-dependent transcriptional regulator
VPRAKKLTPSSEDYLEAILELSEPDGAVRSVDIAEHLSVSKASVTKAMGILREAGLIEQAHYGLIRLTVQGRQRAGKILASHDMLKRFLTDVLGVEESIADQDACRMEHAISDETRSRWLDWMKNTFRDLSTTD